VDIVTATIEALADEECVVWATIIGTTGSTPASALTKMLVTQGGRTVIGTVGGGCVEADVLREAARAFHEQRCAFLTFHLDEAHPENGMLCGGSIDVLLEPVTRSLLPLLAEMKARRDAGEESAVVTVLDSSGRQRVKHLVAAEAIPDGQRSLAGYVPADLSDDLTRVFRRRETRRLSFPGGEAIMELMPGMPGLIIFGGGHIGRFVSRVAAMAGFRVTIVDDRAEFASRERFPEAAAVVVAEFHHALQQIVITPSTYVLIVTRGHRSDQEVLAQVVATPARYIGMIGSAKKVRGTFDDLRARGVSSEQIGRIHAPVGLDIGAVSAEEIAISIVSEMIHLRRGGPSPLRSKKLPNP
jgi:xanthine dehydrogenase accessory factor